MIKIKVEFELSIDDIEIRSIIGSKSDMIIFIENITKHYTEKEEEIIMENINIEFLYASFNTKPNDEEFKKLAELLLKNSKS